MIEQEATDKSRLEATVKQYVAASSELSQRVHRFEIKAGRIYLYGLHEQFGWDNPEAQFKKPLIDEKYAESPMARITLYDVRGEKCEAGFQRHTGQWISLCEGMSWQSLRKRGQLRPLLFLAGSMSSSDRILHNCIFYNRECYNDNNR
ncbi:hypothetical protein J7E73_07875 [Paenibacillus albidus]|uniref:hypothetical protein n=1 Tax=Paenibacillus albidus TaxID=2041023 RepID=UPI001BE83A7D|nr:hypothetical protein [Paenibacillus albidus]MBT2289052.1 hypothetical protein [Paenibacillus albidus]